MKKDIKEEIWQEVKHEIKENFDAIKKDYEENIKKDYESKNEYANIWWWYAGYSWSWAATRVLRVVYYENYISKYLNNCQCW